MANFHEDIVNIELENGNIHRTFLNHSIGAGDNSANRFGVRLFRNGVPENVSGSCFGLFIRADGQTVTINNGTVTGNTAYVTLPEACYVVEGQFCLTIKVSGTGNAVTLRIVDGVVSRTSTSVLVDPGTVIPSIEDLIDAIENAVASIPADYSDLLAGIADTYSTSEPYKKGDIVWHDGVLKVNKVPIASGETWNDDHWEDATLADIMVLKSLMFRGRDTNITDSRMLKQIGVHNINTSWYTDLTSDFGGSKVGALICFGNPEDSQIYHILYLETGEMYTRWVHKSSASAGDWVHINAIKDFTNVLSLKGQGGVTDSKLLPVGFYNCNTSWYEDLSEDLGEGLIGVLFVYGNPANQHYEMFIQETGDIYMRWVNAAGTSAGAFQHITKPFSRTNRYFAFGDSRCAGYLAGSGNTSQYRYPKFIADQMGMSYSNYAVSGSGLWARNDHQAAIDRVQSVDDLDEATLITIEWGVNDYQHPIGTYEDTGDTTWCGRLYQLISYIMQTAPNATLIVIGSANTAEGTQANSWGYGYTLSSGWSLGGLIDEEAKLCAKYHIPFISGYDDPFNDFNIESLMPDDLHYLDQGYLMRSRYLYGKIRALMGVNVPEDYPL